jgi:hypothetical protein
MKNENEKLPKMIGIGTVGLEKQIREWRKNNKRTPWSFFIRDCVAVAYPDQVKARN